MSYKIKSILRSILDEVKMTSNLSQAQTIIRTQVGASRINEVDKRRILLSVTQCRTYNQLLQYVYNSLLTYEGDKVINKSLNSGKFK